MSFIEESQWGLCMRKKMGLSQSYRPTFEDEVVCTYRADDEDDVCGKVWLVTVSNEGFASTISKLTGYICPDCSGYNSDIFPARRK